MDQRHVFVSYATSDKDVAMAVCAFLERLGHRCWIAPRDVPPGAEFTEAILRAITESSALLLVFSSHANASPHVAREVERAVSRHRPVLPVRIEATAPSGSLEYLLSTTQWLDVPPRPAERDFEAIDHALRRLCGDAASAPPSPPAAAPLARAIRGLAGAAVALTVVAGVATWRILSTQGPAPDKSVAVLPFENLSGEKDSQYFTDGLQDAVITHLASVHDLKVISRTSVLRYRERNDRELADIARELGAAHIVEGSVQRVGSRLRLNAQLIRASTDSHIWAAEFDRDVGDTFKVQSELAEQIALAVQANLTGEERARIRKAPTRSIEAQQYYVRAMDLWSRVVSYGSNPDLEGRAYLQRAVTLDPEFAASWALMSMLDSNLAFDSGDAKGAHAANARLEADKALQLDPELAESHIARAFYHMTVESDATAAMRELEIARRFAPAKALVHEQLAPVYWGLGRTGKAIATAARAAELNPHSEEALALHATYLGLVRRFAEADAAWARVARIAALPDIARVWRAQNRFRWTGDVATLNAQWDRVAIGGSDAGCRWSRSKSYTKFLLKMYVDAADTIMACPDSFVRDGGPPEYFAARYLRREDPARASRLFAQARPKLEHTLTQAPPRGRIRVRVSLARTLAALGDRTGSLREIDEALRSAESLGDTWARVSVTEGAAELFAELGDRERALEMLERSFSLPGGAYAHEIELDPSYEALRDDPRYRKLIAEHLPRPPGPLAPL